MFVCCYSQLDNGLNAIFCRDIHLSLVCTVRTRGLHGDGYRGITADSAVLHRGSGDKITENTAVVMGMGTKYYCYRGSGDNCIEFTAVAAVVGTDLKNRGSPRYYRGKMLLLFILDTKGQSLNTLFPFDTQPLILLKFLIIMCFFVHSSRNISIENIVLHKRLWGRMGTGKKLQGRMGTGKDFLKDCGDG